MGPLTAAPVAVRCSPASTTGGGGRPWQSRNMPTLAISPWGGYRGGSRTLTRLSRENASGAGHPLPGLLHALCGGQIGDFLEVRG